MKRPSPKNRCGLRLCREQGGNERSLAAPISMTKTVRSYRGQVALQSARHKKPRGRQAPKASQARSSNTGCAACRQLTIATRKRAIRFGAARGTELRAQERTELLPAERLL